MRENNLIYGISPKHIVTIRMRPGSAIPSWDTGYVGRHPVINRMVRKRYPLLTKLPVIKDLILYKTRTWQRPRFEIVGVNNRVIKTVYSRSNADLKSKFDYATDLLDNFVGKNDD